MSGVVGGSVEALASAFPGAEVQDAPAARFPGEDAIVVVPVVLPLTEPRTTTGIAGGRVIGDMVLMLNGAVTEPGAGLMPGGAMAALGVAETAVVVDVTLITDGESS